MFRLLTIAACALVLTTFNARAFDACGPLKNAFGPYDYRARQEFRDKLYLVEIAHFTESVQMLQRGNTSSLGGDIDYTLRAFPNHPRALSAMANLAIRDRTDKPSGAKYTVDCYFERAIRFAPDDGTVHMIYGNWLFKTGAKDKALQEYQTAEKYAENDANLQYNLGLYYLDAKEYDKALAHAHKAYDLGFQLPGLRNKLVAAGKWRDELAKPPGSDSTTAPSK